MTVRIRRRALLFWPAQLDGDARQAVLAGLLPDSISIRVFEFIPLDDRCRLLLATEVSIDKIPYRDL